jgi:AraC-like DNA-binding protein
MRANDLGFRAGYSIALLGDGAVCMRYSKPKDFRSIPSATGGIARLACARLRELGKDVKAVLSKAGLRLEEVADPTVRLEVRTQIKFLEFAAEELRDDFLGFHLARSFDLREIGLAYYVMASSEQLADALRNAEHYSRINTDGVRLRFKLDGTADIAIDYVNVDRGSDRHQIEFWLVTLMRICRQLTDSRIAARRLKVRHSRAGSPVAFKSFFGTDVEFDADTDEIVFPALIASLPIVGRDTYLNKLLRRYAEEALASRPEVRASIHSRVERIIPQLLPHGRAEVSEVARQLGMSSRTLSRKLLDEGVTYAEILDKLWSALAKRYLSDRELPVTEIAWLLGYRDVSSFTHAFKRRTGMTPREFRLSDCGRGEIERPAGRRRTAGRRLRSGSPGA